MHIPLEIDPSAGTFAETLASPAAVADWTTLNKQSLKSFGFLGADQLCMVGDTVEMLENPNGRLVRPSL